MIATAEETQVLTVDQIEEVALLKLVGATCLNAELQGRRVQVAFAATPAQLDDLAAFRANRGPEVLASEFTLSMANARSLIFSARRAGESTTPRTTSNAQNELHEGGLTR